MDKNGPRLSNRHRLLACSALYAFAATITEKGLLLKDVHEGLGSKIDPIALDKLAVELEDLKVIYRLETPIGPVLKRGEKYNWGLRYLEELGDELRKEAAKIHQERLKKS